MVKKVNRKRQALIAKIHIAKQQLCFDDDTYRDVLRLASGGKTSCKDMTMTEMKYVMQAMKVKGFKPKQSKKSINEHGRKPRVADSRKAYLSKIEALLADQGKHWRYATAVAKRMCGKEAIEFCTDDELIKVLQALAVYQYRHSEKK